MNINGVIVVEGNADKAYLSSFINSNFVVTNGFCVSKNLNFLKKVEEKDIRIIVLTDPDFAGEKIAKEIQKNLQKALIISVNPLKCSKHGKHGVAECEKEEIINKLKPFSSTNSDKSNNITKCFFFKNKISGINYDKELKRYLNEMYSLNATNTNQMIDRLNILKITQEEILEKIKEYYGNQQK